MGVVIKHAPSEDARYILFAQRRVHDGRVAERLLLPVSLAVERLGREHMSVAFADKIGFIRIGRDILFLFASAVRPVVGEVVVGVNILQKTALFIAAHAGCLSGRIQRAGNGVRLFVKRVVIDRFVDPYAPEEHGRVGAVLKHHVLDIADGLCFPFLSADMLPARYLRENQKPYLVASVEKCL